jgi:hypothetical protein
VGRASKRQIELSPVQTVAGLPFVAKTFKIGERIAVGLDFSREQLRDHLNEFNAFVNETGPTDGLIDRTLERARRLSASEVLNDDCSVMQIDFI